MSTLPDSHATSTRPRATLSARRGWFKVHRADLELIRERIASPLALGVWLALLDLANSARNDSFAASIALVAHKGRCGYRATWGLIGEIESLGLIRVFRNVRDGSTRPKGPSTFAILSGAYAPDANPVCKRRQASRADKDQEERKKVRPARAAAKRGAASRTREEEVEPEAACTGGSTWFTGARR